MRTGGSGTRSKAAGRMTPSGPRYAGIGQFEGRTGGMRGRGMLADRLTDQSICPALENDHRMRAAAIQMNSTGDRPRNRATAERLVRAAAADGATLVVLPEKWNVLGTPSSSRPAPSRSTGRRSRGRASSRASWDRPDRRLDR